MKAGNRGLRFATRTLIAGLLILATVAVPIYAAVVMSEDFESSTWNTNWTGSTLPQRVAAPASGHGSYSLRQSTAPQRATRNNFTAIPSNTPLAVRFWFYDTTGAMDNFTDIRNAAASQIFALGNQNQSTNYDYRLMAPSAGSNGWSTTSLARTYGAWKKLEIYYNGTTHATWLVDNVVALDRTDITNMGVNFDTLVCGNGSGSGNLNYSYIDDIALIRDPRKVTINQTPTGGAVSGTVGGSSFPVLTGYYGDGEVITLTATSTDSNYVFQKWTDGAGATLSTNPTYAYTVTTASAQTVNAVFIINGYTLTTTSCPTAGGSTTPGYIVFQTAGPATVTATANPAYKFTGWSSGACGGTIISANASYTFTLPLANVAMYANFTPRLQVNTFPCPAAGVTTSPSTYADAGDPITVTATAKPGYTWQYWTDDSCAGSHVVSMDPTYAFTMPATNVNLYAHVTASNYGFSVSTCSGGTVTGPSGMIATDTPVTVTATPLPGYQFLGWSTGCGNTNYISTSPTYTFNMPPNDLDLYANFWKGDTSKGLFVDTFETYGGGGTSFDSIDKNDTVGPNPATNGSGNPWWGSNPPNGRVNTALGHYSNKSLWGTAGNCKDMVNLQFRANAGSAITGNVYLDWWFYDPFGPGGTTGAAPNFCGDYTALSYYTGIPTGTDYPTPVPYPMTGNVQQLAIGMSDDLSTGYDPTKYQVRIVGDATGYHSGWSNTAAGRSVGWHHSRVVIGPRKVSNTNDVTFYIDNMSAPVVPTKDSITTNGFNILEANTIMPVAGSVDSSSGALYSKYYHFSSIDDVCFGAVPNAPIAATPGPVYTDRIIWNWIDGSGNESGFNVWDSAAGGTIKAFASAGVTSAIDGCLQPNTQYYRWVDSFITQYCGNVDGPRVALAPTYTLAMPPANGPSGPNAVSCNRPGIPAFKYATGTATTFTTVNGFGAGANRASSYLYIWDTAAGEPSSWTGAASWTSGTLSRSPNTEGAYYLHLRACNGDGVANPTTTTFGPFVYDNSTPVAKISDLWPLPDSTTQSYSVANKTVSGLWTDGFWIEETDRSSGIKVLWTGAPVGSDAVRAGDSVDVTGLLSSGDERILTASIVIDHLAAPGPIKPLLMTERYMTGNNAYNPIVPGAKGIYNVGLLVKVAGTAGNAGSNYFYLDDGTRSGGIKVTCGSITPPTAGYQIVTGVIGVVNHEPVLYALSIQAQ